MIWHSLKWQDADGTMIAAARADGSVVIVEPGSSEWDDIMSSPGQIAPWMPATEPAIDPRATASLDRVTFCKALKNLGVLPVAEAVIAARGEWPATFASFVTGLSEDAAADAQIEWAGAANIHYTHPLLQQLALAYAAGDPAQATAILDAIFGIA